MDLKLNFKLDFLDLYSTSGLKKIDYLFLNFLRLNKEELYDNLIRARGTFLQLDEKAYSNLIVEVSKYLEAFISELFNLDEELRKLKSYHKKFDPIYLCKRLFVQKRATKKYSKEEAELFDSEELEANLLKILEIQKFHELSFAIKVLEWLKDNDEEKLDLAAKYAYFAVYTEKGKKKHQDDIIFKLPHKLNFERLVEVESYFKEDLEILRYTEDRLKNREGFNLTDQGSSLKYILDQTTYCIHCHNQSKDSCSKGVKDKEGNYTTSILNNKLTGCPLEEKISEMNLLKSQAFPIGALATAIIDNPMLAATGHRICNDCMKSCIYQKQEPVNIPEIETKVLKDILNLPWGFEIYSLLTRWNPLNLARPYPKNDSNYKVLVVGLGPAGFTLSHHLLNDGHIVVGIDGLKIEPLPTSISGVDIYGQRQRFKPIYDVEELFEKLDQRVAYGFGGVEEYGITVRWNKNYLKLIRLLLERRENFRMYGGIRFGSTITYQRAWDLGFDHISLAVGAGKPNLLSIPNSLVRGIRTASDFLMSLQLTGASKKDSIANLQIRLPLVVVGGGLTAIDSATEALAYYPVQVEKFYERYRKLDSTKFQNLLDEEEKLILIEYLSHAEEILKERAEAQEENRKPNLIKLLKKWGGVKVIYRKSFQDAPCYRVNYEEVAYAFQEGIEFIENTDIIDIETDEFNSLLAVKVNQNEIVSTIPARNMILAIGTNPNTTLAKEYPDVFRIYNKYFSLIDVDNSQNNIRPETIPKPKERNFITSINENYKAVSFFGDAHPSYAGNVVKAMASAKHGYVEVSKILTKSSANLVPVKEFFDNLDNLLIATVKSVEYLTPNILEVTIKASLASEEFQPGQFYRLQNFELGPYKQSLNHFGMESLAMTGAIVDKANGLISVIVLEMGGSSNLCSKLAVNEPIILMGPTGQATHIPEKEKVLLIGGGLGNAVLLSIGKEMKEKSCEVLYLAGYKKSIDRYKIKEIEEASSHVIWSCEEEVLSKNRAQDLSYRGNVIEALEAYNKEDLNNSYPKLEEIDRIIAIGSAGMMKAVAEALANQFKSQIKSNCTSIGSINSPMQCMMKEICAQCIQRHYNPQTKLETYVYSCFNQDQFLNQVDFSHLQSRLKQNSLQEKLIIKWLEDLF